MNKIKSLALVLAFAAVLLSPSLSRAQDFTPTEERLASREQFQDDKFGILIHWGIYSMLASGEWVQNTQFLDHREYADLARGFYPSQFNAAEWVSIFKAAGAKYISITTRHHDGFSMFGTKYTPYSIMEASPFKRDIVMELAEECKKQGLALHFYYSLIDWSREDALIGKNDDRCTVVKDPSKIDQYFDFMKNQLTELLTNYGDVVREIWFDGHWDWDQVKNPEFSWRYDEIYGLIHELRPDVLIGNNHHINVLPGEDVQIFEQDLPGENTTGFAEEDVDVSDLPLEICQTMNDSWGYNIKDKKYKGTTALIRYLVKAAGSNANLLLNVGPRPDGTLPDVAVEELLGIGEWLNEYGFTIYGTRGGDIPSHDWGVVTQKDNVRYVHILSLKDDTLYVPITGGKVTSAVCVNTGEKIKFTQDGEGVLLKLGAVPTDIDHIISLTLK